MQADPDFAVFADDWLGFIGELAPADHRADVAEFAEFVLAVGRHVDVGIFRVVEVIAPFTAAEIAVGTKAIGGVAFFVAPRANAGSLVKSVADAWNKNSFMGIIQKFRF